MLCIFNIFGLLILNCLSVGCLLKDDASYRKGKFISIQEKKDQKICKLIAFIKGL